MNAAARGNNSNTSFFSIATALSLIAMAACARVATVPEPAAAPPAASRAPWEPSPNARRALEQLLAAEPFAAPAATLAEASGGRVPRMYNAETLLFDRSVSVRGDGSSVAVQRTVWRVLDDSPDQTATFDWSPWRQKRPEIRARVVSPDGVESWLDPKSIVDGTAAREGLELSDVRQLHVPLPNVRRGSVVELQIVRVSTRPALQGTGVSERWSLWSLQPVRRRRFRVELPASMPLAVEAVGVPAPKPVKHGDRQSIALDVGEIDFKPFALNHSQIEQQTPRFGWSTTRSWEDVERQYRPIVERALADEPDLSSLEPAMKAAKSRAEKAQAVLRWVSEHLRYTAVNLGDGAIVPTSPRTVLSRGYGDCKDLSVLVASALRHFGVPADVALVMAGGTSPSPGLPGIEAFNHMIVVVPGQRGGDRLWIDPTAPDYPVGVLPLGDREQKALIIDPSAKGLAATPTRAQTPLVEVETFEVRPASFGAGSARITIENRGAAEGLFRGIAKACDAATAHQVAEPVVTSMFGETPFTAKLEHCKPGEGPLTVVAEVPKANVIDTSDRGVMVQLPSRILDRILPDGIIGEQPGQDERDATQKADARRRILEQTGLTQEELEQRAFDFSNQPVIERVYRINLPPHFVAGDLPSNRTIHMGPGKWTESFSVVDARTVEARFRFETQQTEWSVDDVKAFRKAFWRRFDENMPVVAAIFEPARLLEERRPAQAVALVRTWLTQTPNDGPTLARFARILSELGLGALARKEIDHALAVDPDDPLVLMICGDVARRDLNGDIYSPPFERDKAIACLRKAHRVLPDHSWAVDALADTLWRNEAGEQLVHWTDDVAEAAGLVQQMVDRNEATKEMASKLAEMYLRCGKLDALKKLYEQQPVLAEAGDQAAMVSAALTGGADAVLRRVESRSDPKQRLAALGEALAALGWMRRYDDASTLLDRFDPGPALASEVKRLRDLYSGLKPAPDAVDTSTPEAAARSVFAIIANGASPTDMSKRLARLASKAGKAELDGTARVFNLVLVPSVDVTFIYDQLYSRATCVTAGNAKLARVRCELPEERSISMVSYWVHQGRTWKLESLGRPSQLAARALAHAKAKRLEQAGLYLGWLIDEFVGRQNDAAMLLGQYWSRAQHDDAAQVRFAAALASVVQPTMAEDASPAILAALEKGRPELSGAMRRHMDVVLTEVLQMRKEYAEAAKVLEPLATSENEPRMWRWLASLESLSGQYEPALARVAKALARDPDQVDWRETKAVVLMGRGRYREALKILEKLREEKGKAADVTNNLLWAQLMAKQVDEQAEHEAQRIANDESANDAELHTAAMLMLELGRVSEAAILAARLRHNSDGKLDGGQWLLRGRLLQVLGFETEARAAYAKMETKDRDLIELRRRYLSDRGATGGDSGRSESATAR